MLYCVQKLHYLTQKREAFSVMGEWATNSSWLERHVPDVRVREAMRNALLSVSDSEVQVGGASERVCVKLPVLYAYYILLYYI